ncbi:MAG: rhomboid family intramembrane serine protease [Myxococcales bacterium]|jgi:rhomboid protease GluP|nr:rhomboid family intramembrane serine protease [Myxococcales bacterium]MBK7197412.1 rhomboid family intramembrane serine protease [Myxococcales bacterium]MBP6848088.1 rhomboid family intramembrane serine protease [Kofleriaceae bacterium]
MSAAPVRVQRLPTPYVTYGLIAANVGVWLVTLALGLDVSQPDAQRLLELGGNLGERTLGHEPWRLFTSMFLHAGILHVTMNMLALGPTGRQVETLYGRTGMGAIYLVAGLLGALTSAMRGAAVSVGASGAIFGLFGAFGGFLLRHRKRLEPNAAQAALRSVGMVLAINVFISLSVPQIDMAAHLGGLVGGAATGWALEQQPKAWSMARRALVVGGFGALTLIGVSYVVPAGKPDRPAVVDQYYAADKQAVRRFNGLVTRVRAGELNDAQMADAIEREVLPDWRAAFKTLEEGALESEWSPMRQSARRRLDAMTGFAAALRSGDEAALLKHRAELDGP